MVAASVSRLASAGKFDIVFLLAGRPAFADEPDLVARHALHAIISIRCLCMTMRWRQRVGDERSKGPVVLEELLAAEELEIGVLEPAIAQRLVGEIVHVLEDGEAGHEPCG